MKRIFIFLAFILAVSSCKEKGTFSITGVINGDPGKYIYLNRVEINTPVFLDSAKINKSGKFRFKVRASEPDFYQLGYSTNDFITLLRNREKRLVLNLMVKTCLRSILLRVPPALKKYNLSIKLLPGQNRVSIH